VNSTQTHGSRPRLETPWALLLGLWVTVSTCSLATLVTFGAGTGQVREQLGAMREVGGARLAPVALAPGAAPRRVPTSAPGQRPVTPEVVLQVPALAALTGAAAGAAGTAGNLGTGPAVGSLLTRASTRPAPRRRTSRAVLLSSGPAPVRVAPAPTAVSPPVIPVIPVTPSGTASSAGQPAGPAAAVTLQALPVGAPARAPREGGAATRPAPPRTGGHGQPRHKEATRAGATDPTPAATEPAPTATGPAPTAGPGNTERNGSHQKDAQPDAGAQRATPPVKVAEKGRHSRAYD
jgi:hypothetical protein